MRALTAAFLLAALAATPSLAASTSTSWEGVANESQKQGGPYSSIRGPDRSGTYSISRGRAYRTVRTYRYRGIWDY